MKAVTRFKARNDCAILCGFYLVVAAGLVGAAQVRVATFNCALNRDSTGLLTEDLSGGQDPQARAIAEIIQRVRPEILLLNEFDYDRHGLAIGFFQQQYLEVAQAGQKPISYPYSFTAPVNTGMASGLDLDRDGKTEGPGDAFGYGRFEGQYGMALLSRFPVRDPNVRTFQQFLWKDMPGGLLPDDVSTAESGDWYNQKTLAVFRLSSKSHWDIPIEIDGKILHILACHPTPPVFDGAEDRNGRRNHDEIRFWADYITPDRSGYIYDDRNRFGGLPSDALFVICGDLNADPADGDGRQEAITGLLAHPCVQDPQPASKGAAAQQGGVNAEHITPTELDTYQSRPGKSPGNLRLDYVLPCRTLMVIKTGVFWPETSDPLSRLTAGPPHVSSDHRLVYVDIEIPE